MLPSPDRIPGFDHDDPLHHSTHVALSYFAPRTATPGAIAIMVNTWPLYVKHQGAPFVACLPPPIDHTAIAGFDARDVSHHAALTFLACQQRDASLEPERGPAVARLLTAARANWLAAVPGLLGLLTDYAAALRQAVGFESNPPIPLAWHAAKRGRRPRK